ncbi:MAG TPA: NAD(P)/FAD-dependent oxidoreductase, partial [Dehalococcoidia bacterium]|nr:NAD(P)/FAD-dependent oxidoreductase [Dehalococcoidia bacterium]
RSVELDSDGVTVRTEGRATGPGGLGIRGGSYRGRALVGADGANGIVTRAAGLERPREATVGLEGKLAPPPEALLAWRKTVAFQLGVLPWGYGWLFPKGDHLNVGLWQRGAAPRREELAALVRRLGFDPRALAEVRGHLLPLGRPGTPLVRGPVLLVGDAAGLADPLTGEGIYGAVRSGQMAARALSCYLSGEARDLSAYQEEVDEQLLADLQVARQIRDIFYRRPELFLFLLAHSRRLWEALCQLVRGDTSYRAFKGKLGPLAPLFDGAAALARPRR